MEYINNDEKLIVEVLKEINQQHIIDQITKYKHEDRLAFISQIKNFENTYNGGLKAYYNKVKQLLKENQENINQYDGFIPKIPSGEKLSLKNLARFNNFEQIGIEEMEFACFVLGKLKQKQSFIFFFFLVAGGCGERLGYKDIKISLPIDLVTYFILAFQQKCKQAIPFAIMTSDDTHKKTIELLENNNYYNMPRDQIKIVMQQKVPTVNDNEAHFVLLSDKLLLETKPHGHGDVHAVLYQSGIIEKWESQNRKWVIIFQDTNPLIFRAIPAVLGVSKLKQLEMNSVCVPRKPGEPFGEIIKLQKKDGSTLTINVEYNQLDSFWSNTSLAKQPIDSKGFSLYPGNINSLVFSLPEYFKTLKETNGLICEFINPKYTDSTKQQFASTTRLECMMQDYPKLLKSGDMVGYTQVDRNYCFSPLKNSLKLASQRQIQGLAPESAGSCEQDFYWQNAQVLRAAGAQIEFPLPQDEEIFYDVKYNFGPRIILSPFFGVTIEDVKKNIKGIINISKQSTFWVNGKLTLGNIKVDGICKIEGNGSIGELSIEDKKYNNFIQIDIENENTPTIFKIRGYKLI